MPGCAPALFGFATAPHSSGIVDSNPAALAASPGSIAADLDRRRQALVESAMSWVDDDGDLLVCQMESGEPICPPYVLSGSLDLHEASPSGPRQVRKRDRDASFDDLLREEEVQTSRRQVTAIDDESWRTRGWGTGQHSVWRKSAPKATREAVAQAKGSPSAALPPSSSSSSSFRVVTKKPTSNPKAALSGAELEAHRMSQRRKQVMFGKDTVGYTRYRDLVPRERRGREDPQTPDFTDKTLSKRAFDGIVRQWRRALHKWDLPEEGAGSSTPEKGPGLQEVGQGLVEPYPFVDSEAEDDPPAATGDDMAALQAGAQQWWCEVRQRACQVGTAQAEALGVHVKIAEQTAVDLRELFRQQANPTSDACNVSWSVSLKDPLNGNLIDVPARGIQCRHVQSFDLASLLRRAPSGPRFIDPSDGLPCIYFQCPVCDSTIKSSNLMLDCFTGGALYAAYLVGEGAQDSFHFCPADGHWRVDGFRDMAALQGSSLCPG
eukprot:GGOE01010706.1.p1 GENE.GGOE01010706.1~~GGOE01010706.1.p1  ORF type:complete len:512 (+),score=97.46 GGOE01010706.1:61-1536(+)